MNTVARPAPERAGSGQNDRPGASPDDGLVGGRRRSPGSPSRSPTPTASCTPAPSDTPTWPHAASRDRRGPVPVVLHDQDRHRHHRDAAARRRGPRPRRAHRRPTCPATARIPGTAIPPLGSCSPTPPDSATRCRSGGSAPRANQQTRPSSRASSPSTAHPSKPVGARAGVLQHRLPPGRRRHRGRHRARPSRTVSTTLVLDPAGHGRDRLPPTDPTLLEPSATRGCPASLTPGAAAGCCPRHRRSRVDGLHQLCARSWSTAPAYGGLVGTVTDAARLAAAHAADGHATPTRCCRTATSSRCAPSRPRANAFDHGIGWFRRPADADRSPAFVEHYGTGGGFWNAMRIYPDHRLAIVAMANTTASVGRRLPLHPDSRPAMDTDPSSFDVDRARRDTPGVAHVAHLNNAGAALPPRRSPTPSSPTCSARPRSVATRQPTPRPSRSSTPTPPSPG